MLSFFFDVLHALLNALFSVASFAADCLFSLLSAIASLLLWPAKTLFHGLQDWWSLPPQWAVLSLVGLFVVLAALAFLALLGYASFRKKRGR